MYLLLVGVGWRDCGGARGVQEIKERDWMGGQALIDLDCETNNCDSALTVPSPPPLRELLM